MPDKEGFLSKRLTAAFVQRWQKRYFVVHDAKVTYFKDAKKDRLLGAVDLRHATLEHEKGQPTFTLVHDSDGQLEEMRADSIAEAIRSGDLAACRRLVGQSRDALGARDRKRCWDPSVVL